MLSGLTSQFGSLIGKKTTSNESPNQDQQPLQQPTADTPTTTTDSKDVSQEQSTTAGSEVSANPATILSSVRNHIAFPSWLGGAKKPEEESTVTPSASSPQATPSRVKSDDDNDSSATGGADSDEQISEEEPGAAAAGPGGLDKVKNLGNLLFSTIKGAGQKIKETSMLADFQREHDSFLKSKGKSSENALVPWVGHAKEEQLKEEILSLSNDRRNFVRSPPQGINFQWDWAEAAPVAKAILAQDPNLETMRYALVPKVITEENFWRNYFYRVQLLKECYDDTKPQKRRGSSSEEEGDGEDADLEKELNEELKSFEVVGGESKHDEKEIDSLLDLK